MEGRVPVFISSRKRVAPLYPSYITTYGLSASLSWCQELIWASDQFFLLLNVFRQLRVCWFRAPSLMRGQVCSLQLLLGLASAVLTVLLITSWHGSVEKTSSFCCRLLVTHYEWSLFTGWRSATTLCLTTLSRGLPVVLWVVMSPLASQFVPWANMPQYASE
jgi:hypothetical protein